MSPALSFDIDKLQFHDPAVLLAIPPAVALVIWRYRRRRRHPAILFPSVRPLRSLPRSLRARLLPLIPAMQIAALVLLLVGAARPREGDERTIVRSEGIAIQMVLDRSSSMETPMSWGGRQEKRIEIVKKVFSDFVTGGGSLPGRKTDLIGLTTFARFTEENCPLVAEHEPLLTAVQNLTTVEPVVDIYGRPVPRDELPARLDRRKYRANPLDGTAIGDGIMRAVYALVSAEEDLKRTEGDGGYRIKSKVIILLTDGEDNASSVDPVEAGKYAAQNGIRLYYILMRDNKDYGLDIFGRRYVRRVIPRDELLEVPRKVAGSPERAFLATDGDALERIYRQIDAMERSEVGRIQYRQYRERFHLFVIPGLVFAALSLLLSETLFRRIP